ncbi:UNVERIFIED_CONTAM: hypothetical protein Slati_1086800 [Sesamum latifolium]|uniref:MADS-box domain-containing protein n=1 Tax=Sesamum latifolium TaxID=2727402 RepID=A0AAW2XUL1_9LAMI
MGRRKLRRELISNEKARVAAFEKRKKSLEKAAYELSTLCGVHIGIIVYSPARNNKAKEPTICPRNGHESGIIYTESGASMDPSVQENAVFEPRMWTDIMQQQQPLAYCDAQATIMAYQRWTMMMKNGASCSQNTFSFGQNPENAVSMPSMWTDIMQQNCGMGIMENVGANNGEPLMSYYNVPNMEQMPQNMQRLFLSGAFPEMQAAWGADNVQRHGF